MTKMLIAVLMVVGCGGPVDHIEYWADDTLSAQDAAAACAAWTNGVGVECKAVDVMAANVLITAFRDDASDEGGITYTWKQPVSIKVNLKFASDMATTIAHEMGHAMGIGHLDDGFAIMNTTAEYGIPTVLTDVDIAGYRTVYPTQ